MDWTDEQNLETLGQHIDAGLSSTESAARFGVTSDAVIGAAYRQGWGFGRPRPPRPELPPMNALIAVEEAPEPATLEELAAVCLDQHRIVQNALEPMLSRVYDDPEMMSQVMARLVSAECGRVLQAVIATRHQEHKRKSGGGPLGASRTNRAADTEAWAQAVSDALLDTHRLPSGKKLGDATRADLQTALAAHEIQASDATIKHRWMRLILQSTPAGKTVREVLTEERVKELREEARKGDA